MPEVGGAGGVASPAGPQLVVPRAVVKASFVNAVVLVVLLVDVVVLVEVLCVVLVEVDVLVE